MLHPTIQTLQDYYTRVLHSHLANIRFAARGDEEINAQADLLSERSIQLTDPTDPRAVAVSEQLTQRHLTEAEAHMVVASSQWSAAVSQLVAEIVQLKNANNIAV